MSASEASAHMALSQKFLLEAEAELVLAVPEELGAQDLSTYLDLMEKTLESGAETDEFKAMEGWVNTFTEPKAWSALRLAQPHTAEGLLKLKQSIGQFQTALNPAPGIYG